MCGITGIISKKAESEFHLPQCLERMNQLIEHRGPDDEGFLFGGEEGLLTAGGLATPEDVFNGPECSWLPQSHIRNLAPGYNFGLGHRRLSILDLSPSGHQPMCSTSRNIWITFNGEIYNFIELREELKAAGFTFYTETDTEVIINAYQHWGQACVNRFNGMWAFVIYDHSQKTFFGSRDRMGVKPFYYYHDDAVFAFASEQKALAAMPFVKTGVNAKAVYDFFVLNAIEYEEEGFFKNVFELPPSYSFTFHPHSGDFTKWRYYELNANTEFLEFNSSTAERYEEELAGLISDAVKLRLRSDVAVGTCLSGGVDSSAITGVIQQQHSRYYLETFTVSFEDKIFDESHWAKEMAQKPNTNWNRVFPNSTELYDDLERLLYCQDVPIWSTSTYAQYRVMKLAADNNIKVVLSGQGGDELFGGYPSYLFPFYKELLNNGKLSQFSQAVSAFGDTGNFFFFAKQLLKTKSSAALPASFRSKAWLAVKKELPYLNKDFYSAYSDRIEKLEEDSPSTLNQALKNDLDNRLLKKFLKCEDRCSMAHSVESRIPFSDSVQLIEFALQVPSAYKIRDGYQKYILRKAAGHFVPEKIAMRKDKMGYVTPNNKWVSEIFPKIQHIFEQPALKEFLDTEKILRKSQELFNPQKPDIHSMEFKFISFAFWMKIFENSLNNKKPVSELSV
jgi:asparagine synthase (glutamine-hydrolysing)